MIELTLAQRDSMMKRFFEEMREKKFYKQFCSLLMNDESLPLGEIETAKAMSSMLTHSLIEMEKQGLEVYEGLGIKYQTILLAKFIGGEVDEAFIRGRYKEKFGPYFRG